MVTVKDVIERTLNSGAGDYVCLAQPAVGLHVCDYSARLMFNQGFIDQSDAE